MEPYVGYRSRVSGLQGKHLYPCAILLAQDCSDRTRHPAHVELGPEHPVGAWPQETALEHQVLQSFLGKHLIGDYVKSPGVLLRRFKTYLLSRQERRVFLERPDVPSMKGEKTSMAVKCTLIQFPTAAFPSLGWSNSEGLLALHVTDPNLIPDTAKSNA